MNASSSSGGPPPQVSSETTTNACDSETIRIAIGGGRRRKRSGQSTLMQAMFCIGAMGGEAVSATFETTENWSPYRTAFRRGRLVREPVPPRAQSAAAGVFVAEWARRMSNVDELAIQAFRLLQKLIDEHGADEDLAIQRFFEVVLAGEPWNGKLPCGPIISDWPSLKFEWSTRTSTRTDSNSTGATRIPPRSS